MNIHDFDIDISDMPVERVTKRFEVTGEKNAEFRVVALQNPSSSSAHTLYYDWTTSSFESGYNDMHNSLTIKLKGSRYTNNIVFPSDSGGDYVIKLITMNGTGISNSNSTVITKSITKQAATKTLTFKPGSRDTSYYQSLPTVTSTGSQIDTGTANTSFSIVNSTTDAKSHGFTVTREGVSDYGDEFWYFQTTEAVVTNGSGTDGEDTTSVKVASIADLTVGMDLIYYKGTTTPELNDGSSAGGIRITAIEGDIITFSSEVGFDEGQTMTFRAYGSELINNAIGCSLMFGEHNLLVTPLTTTVRANVSSSTSVTIGATLGIGGGKKFGFTGLNVNNSSANLIATVTPDPDGSDTDGVMVVGLAQTLTAGTVLSIEKTFSTCTLSGIITINTYPSDNREINFDLDKVLTVGVSGS